ncbi:hypothetical protein SUGI_0872250 [Cryptomeria japonica]|nr:hypothetical protein SUGI_0872250 [Cryptomeria japonica]
MEATQVSLGGFGQDLSAKELTEYLEDSVGMLWRCRLKTSWTPPYSFPNFTKTNGESSIQNKAKVPPHAFVHFASPGSVNEVIKLVERGRLMFKTHALKVNFGNGTSFRRIKRTIEPLRFSDVKLEIGSMYSPDQFWVAWRAATSGVDFHVDPFDRRCRILFTRDQVFTLGEGCHRDRDTVIKCEFKIEFLVRDIRDARFLNERGTLVMLLQLWVPPWIFYRTADDDIYVRDPFALLDDDDPWIRTLDFTPNNALGRCLVYKISLSPRMGHTMEKAKAYFKQHRLVDEKFLRLRTLNEHPVAIEGFFLVLPPDGEIHFDTMYLLNALVHKGIVNYHRLTPEVYAMLKPSVTPTELSTMALRHILAYTNPIYDAFTRLKSVIGWISRTPELPKSPKIAEETVEVRRLIITPTKAYCLPPEVELSNRVIRHFKRYADRFLRVTFMDDSMEPMSSGALTVHIAPIVKQVSFGSPAHRTAIYRRVKQIMHSGFELCGRKYSFLAFSANQLRDRSAWKDHSRSCHGSCSEITVEHQPSISLPDSIWWLQRCGCNVGRQIITLLSALSVPDSAFNELQDSMMHKLSQMVENVEVAFDILTTSCTGDLQSTATLMLRAGFKPQTEPHLKDTLSSIRAVQLEELLKKCRIFVPDGRWLMGCLDEIGELEYGQCFIKVSNIPVDGCILKNGSSFGERRTSTTVIKGKKGLRPHPNEASGSDLDGDIYFVSWDSRLIPPSGESCEPMDYDPGQLKESTEPVKTEDVIEFFVQHMVNDSLGVICNAHVVLADLSDCGALDEDCLKLAELAAMAVDFPKTGKVAVMPQYLKPKQYPDFMDKEVWVSYKSEKILGKLYRKVKDMFGEEIEKQKCFAEMETLPYDNDLEVNGFEEYIEEAWECKCSYDQQLQALLGQFSVKKEGEVVTGNISSLSKYSSRRQGEIKERLQHAYRSLRKEFRLIFEGSKDSQNLESCEQAKYVAKASAWYHVTYHSTWVQKNAENLTEPGGYPSAPLLSFAWIAVDYLAQIKLRKFRPDVVNFGSQIISESSGW